MGPRKLHRANQRTNDRRLPCRRSEKYPTDRTRNNKRIRLRQLVKHDQRWPAADLVNISQRCTASWIYGLARNIADKNRQVSSCRDCAINPLTRESANTITVREMEKPRPTTNSSNSSDFIIVGSIWSIICLLNDTFKNCRSARGPEISFRGRAYSPSLCLFPLHLMWTLRSSGFLLQLWQNLLTNVIKIIIARSLQMK